MFYNKAVSDQILGAEQRPCSRSAATAGRVAQARPNRYPQKELRSIQYRRCVSLRSTSDCKDSNESLKLVSSPASFIAWAYEGKPSTEAHRSGSHMPDRIIDFPQWKKASRTCTNIAMRGVFPFNAICSRRSESLTRDAVPATRTTSRRFGTMKMMPTLGFSRTLRNVSARWLPSRSGIASVCLSRTFTKPAS